MVSVVIVVVVVVVDLQSYVFFGLVCFFVNWQFLVVVCGLLFVVCCGLLSVGCCLLLLLNCWLLLQTPGSRPSPSTRHTPGKAKAPTVGLAIRQYFAASDLFIRALLVTLSLFVCLFVSLFVCFFLVCLFVCFCQSELLGLDDCHSPNWPVRQTLVGF